MAAINFELKEYQRLALGRFSDYLSIGVQSCPPIGVQY